MNTEETTVDKQVDELFGQLKKVLMGQAKTEALSVARAELMERLNAEGPPATAPATGTQPMAARPRRQKEEQKVCPILHCRGIAVKKFGLVCRDHKDIPKKEKLEARLSAKGPTGKWARHEHAVPRKRGRPHKAA